MTRSPLPLWVLREAVIGWKGGQGKDEKGLEAEMTHLCKLEKRGIPDNNSWWSFLSHC